MNNPYYRAFHPVGPRETCQPCLKNPPAEDYGYDEEVTAYNEGVIDPDEGWYEPPENYRDPWDNQWTRPQYDSRGTRYVSRFSPDNTSDGYTDMPSENEKDEIDSWVSFLDDYIGAGGTMEDAARIIPQQIFMDVVRTPRKYRTHRNEGFLDSPLLPEIPPLGWEPLVPSPAWSPDPFSPPPILSPDVFLGWGPNGTPPPGYGQGTPPADDPDDPFSGWGPNGTPPPCVRF